jgi:hypothetical protein
MLVFAVVHVIHKIPKVEVLDVPTGEALSLVEQQVSRLDAAWRGWVLYVWFEGPFQLP